MRVVKKLCTKNEKTLFISKVFDDVITRTEFPLNFDYIELNVGYGATVVEDDRIVIGVDINDPLLMNMDSRVVKMLLTFELFRVYVRKMLKIEVPRFIEDVIVGKEIVRKGLANDISYIFYILAMTQSVTDIKSFIRANIPWLVFKGEDKFYHKLFHDYARSETKYRIRTKELFAALEKDLWDLKNLKNCIQLYGDVVNAGD